MLIILDFDDYKISDFSVSIQYIVCIVEHLFNNS